MKMGDDYFVGLTAHLYFKITPRKGNPFYLSFDVPNIESMQESELLDALLKTKESIQNFYKHEKQVDSVSVNEYLANVSDGYLRVFDGKEMCEF